MSPISPDLIFWWNLIEAVTFSRENVDSSTNFGDPAAYSYQVVMVSQQCEEF